MTPLRYARRRLETPVAVRTAPELSLSAPMKFIEMTGRSLAAIVKDDELHTGDLAAAGVVDTTVVRVNQHGDIEVRLEKGWDVIGGLLGNFEERVRHQTKLDWA